MRRDSLALRAIPRKDALEVNENQIAETDALRIWIDTDLGSDVDDALALAYGLKHPELEVVGVSTVFGDVELRSRCVASLLKIAGHTEIPVLTGLGKPFTERRTGVMFGHEGLGLLPDPSPRLRIQSEDPRETKTRTSELARALTSAAPDFVVAIGPLTNLAAVLRTGTPLPPLAIMGGKATENGLSLRASTGRKGPQG